MDADQDVVVVGRVRRRFFRSGGVTQSRTEVVAEVVLPTGQTKRVAGVLRAAAAKLEEAANGG
jgi:single-strand DNA-binding protein